MRAPVHEDRSEYHQPDSTSRDQLSDNLCLSDDNTWSSTTGFNFNDFYDADRQPDEGQRFHSQRNRCDLSDFSLKKNLCLDIFHSNFTF